MCKHQKEEKKYPLKITKDFNRYITKEKILMAKNKH
jgi:hypothetical protein